MKKLFLLAVVFLMLPGLFANDANDAKQAQRIMDDLLVEINSPSITKQTKILGKINRFTVVPYPHYNKNFANNKLEATADDKANGFVTFVRSSETAAPHNYRPNQQEMGASMMLFGARGSSMAGFFGVVPFTDFEGATVSVSELKNEKGDLFPADLVRLSLVRHLFRHQLPDVFYPDPFGLEPIDGTRAIKLREWITKTIYIDVDFPSGLAAGNYKGTIDFAAYGKKHSRPLEIKVYDFDVTKAPSSVMNWGFYTGARSEHDYRFMVEHGCNTAVLHSGNNQAHFDFIKNLRKWGIDGILLIDIGGLEHGPDQKAISYSSTWQKLVGEEYRKFHAGMKAIGEDESNYVGVIHDEPRERRDNPWNKSYAQTMVSYKVAGEYAPGMRRGVNPMTDGDKQAFDKLGDPQKTEYPMGVYTNFAMPPDKFEMVMPHYWAHCRNIIDQARKNDVTLWGYNDGNSRYAWGLHSWKVEVQGRTLYHYRHYQPNEHPLSPIFMSSAEFVGRSFTGNYVISWKDKNWSTVLFKGMRDGIADYHYAYTLEQLIKAKPNDPVAIEAASYMAGIKEKFPEYAHSATFVNPIEVGESDANSMGLTAVQLKIVDYCDKLSK